jgi:hypothetical protein
MFTIALFATCVASHAQDLGRADTHLALPGITFDLALNQADKFAKVTGGKLLLSSPGKRDNFRDPDGKLSNNTAPMLLTEIDNRKPFTFSAEVTPKFLNTYDAGALYIWVRDDLC